MSLDLRQSRVVTGVEVLEFWPEERRGAGIPRNFYRAQQNNNNNNKIKKTAVLAVWIDSNGASPALPGVGGGGAISTAPRRHHQWHHRHHRLVRYCDPSLRSRIPLRQLYRGRKFNLAAVCASYCGLSVWEPSVQRGSAYAVVSNVNRC